jgi:hypothetical protein
MNQLLITESDAAKMLLRSAKSLRKARQEGRIAYILQGRTIFYTLADIESYIEQSRVTHICPSTKPKNSPYYHYDFVWQGNRVYGSTGCTGKARRAGSRAPRAAEGLYSRHCHGRQLTLDEAAGMYSHCTPENLDQLADHQISNRGPGRRPGRESSVVVGDPAARSADSLRKAQDRALPTPPSTARSRTPGQLWRRADKAKYDIGDMPSWSDLMLKVEEMPPRELAFAEEDKLTACAR